MAAPGVGPWLVLAVNPKFLVPALSLMAALLAGAAVIALFRRWQRTDKFSPDVGEELARYRALYEQGAISEEEYRSLRAVLSGDLRRSMKVGPKRPEVSTDVKLPPGSAQETLPGTTLGRDVPNTPSDGIRPAE